MKPAYPKNRKTRAVSRDARLLNIHLWNLADDEGRLQELPQWIIGEIFPTDEDVTPVVLREWLGELQGVGLIERYSVDEEDYIECVHFNEHQVINKAKDSEIPPSDAENAISRRTTVETREASLPEKEGKRKGKGRGSDPSRATPSPSKTSSPLSYLLADLVASNGSKRPIVSADWATNEDRMLRLDKRDPAEAERLIRWCQASSFWRPNILSMPKFREKYDTLRLQALEEGGGEIKGSLASKYAGVERKMEA